MRIRLKLKWYEWILYGTVVALGIFTTIAQTVLLLRLDFGEFLYHSYLFFFK